MAIILKKDTLLQKKNANIQRYIRWLNKDKMEFESRQRGIVGSLRILRSRWKRFVILAILIFLAKGVSEDVFYLSLFAFIVTVVLTLGYSKRPYEDEISKTNKIISQISKRSEPLMQGVQGETIVAQELSRLPDSYYIIHDVTLYFKIKVQIDHVVVGPTGIFAIETKSMGGHLRPHINGWLHGNRLIRSPQKQSKQGAFILSSLIGQSVQPAVVLSNSRARWHGELDKDCPVLYGPQLAQYILNQPITILNQKELAQKILDNVIW